MKTGRRSSVYSNDLCPVNGTASQTTLDPTAYVSA
jgi:hypothetical protein